MLLFHMGNSLCLAPPVPVQLPANLRLGKAIGVDTIVWVPATLKVAFGFWLLARLSCGCCDYLGNELMDERFFLYVCVSVCVSQSFFFF